MTCRFLLLVCLALPSVSCFSVSPSQAQKSIRALSGRKDKPEPCYRTTRSISIGATSVSSLSNTTELTDGRRRFARSADMNAAIEEQCILEIDGQRYNLTDWAKAHPGGVNVLRRFNNKDASKSFHATGHSTSAYAMLKDFAIVEDGGNRTASVAVPPSSVTKSPPRWRRKLFTKEDPIGVHKYLGVFCLLHFGFRFLQMYFGDPSAGFGSRLGKGTRIGPVLCLLPHVLLSLSSLLFHTVPKERVVGRPMIWKEYRVHNIAFGLRGVICTFLAWLSVYKSHSAPWRSLAVVGSCLTALTTSLVADEGTRRLRTNPTESTTASMPYWDGCSKETEMRFKTFYAYSQFAATLACIALANPVWAFTTTFSIQAASLLMTLVRKGFLSTKGSHMAYTIFLIIPYMAGLKSVLYIKPWQLPLILTISGILFQLRRLGVNKYALWIPVYVARILYGDQVIPYAVW
jgi:cytochrome b involved in lipid metabolism